MAVWKKKSPIQVGRERAAKLAKTHHAQASMCVRLDQFWEGAPLHQPKAKAACVPDCMLKKMNTGDRNDNN